MASCHAANLVTTKRDVLANQQLESVKFPRTSEEVISWFRMLFATNGLEKPLNVNAAVVANTLRLITTTIANHLKLSGYAENVTERSIIHEMTWFIY